MSNIDSVVKYLSIYFGVGNSFEVQAQFWKEMSEFHHVVSLKAPGILVVCFGAQNKRPFVKQN